MSRPNWLIKVIPRVAIIAVTLSVLVIPILPQQGTVHAAPANAYWVGGTGNTTDATHHWATSSNGTPNAANTPDSTTNVHFDANSANSTINWTVIVDGVLQVKAMDWTGATGNPTFQMNANVFCDGNITFISAMQFPVTGQTLLADAATSQNITTNGLVIGSPLRINNPAGAVLQDDFTQIGSEISWAVGVLNTNNKTLNIQHMDFNGAGIRTLTLGSSNVTVTNWDASGTNQVLTANTATINVLGTGAFNGGSLKTYHNVNLDGTAHTISGSNQYTAFGTNSTATQTLTFTDGTTQNATSFSLSGTSGHQHTLQGSGAGGWTLLKTGGGNVTADYITISRSTGNLSGGATYHAIGGSVDGGNNVNWQFPLTISTGPSSGISMTKDGVTSGNFSGTITDMGGSATVNVWHQYGLTTGYGSSTANVTYSTTNFTGTKQQSFPATLTPGDTYHTRYAITSGANTTYGADGNFTLTMPTVSTSNASRTYHNDQSYITIPGTLSSMGVASSSYIRFNWGYTPALGNNTTAQTANAIGTFTSGEIAVNSGKTVYYQISATVGNVTASGGQLNLTSLTEADNLTGVNSFGGVIPLLVLVAALIGSGVLFGVGAKRHEPMVMTIALVFIGLLFIFYGLIVESINAILTR